MPYFTNKEGLRGLNELLSTGLPYGSVYKINPQVYFQMIYPFDAPQQCLTRNWSSEMAPTMPVVSVDEKHMNTAYRDLHGSLLANGSKRLVYDHFVAKKVKDRKDKFFQK